MRRARAGVVGGGCRDPHSPRSPRPRACAAGAAIIVGNLNGDGELNPCRPGRRVLGVFCHVRVHGWQVRWRLECTCVRIRAYVEGQSRLPPQQELAEALAEDAPLLYNAIAAVVHAQCLLAGGAVMANDATAAAGGFLLAWPLTPDPEAAMEAAEAEAAAAVAAALTRGAASSRNIRSQSLSAPPPPLQQQQQQSQPVPATTPTSHAAGAPCTARDARGAEGAPRTASAPCGPVAHAPSPTAAAAGPAQTPWSRAADRALLAAVRIVAQLARDDALIFGRGGGGDGWHHHGGSGGGGTEHPPRAVLPAAARLRLRDAGLLPPPGGGAASLVSLALHAGWAVEGALGSDRKLDVTYAGPHVALAEGLHGASALLPAGGAGADEAPRVVLTGALLALLSPQVRVTCPGCAHAPAPPSHPHPRQARATCRWAGAAALVDPRDAWCAGDLDGSALVPSAVLLPDADDGARRAAAVRDARAAERRERAAAAAAQQQAAARLRLRLGAAAGGLPGLSSPPTPRGGVGGGGGTAPAAQPTTPRGGGAAPAAQPATTLLPRSEGSAAAAAAATTTSGGDSGAPASASLRGLPPLAMPRRPPSSARPEEDAGVWTVWAADQSARRPPPPLGRHGLVEAEDAASRELDDALRDAEAARAELCSPVPPTAAADLLQLQRRALGAAPGAAPPALLPAPPEVQLWAHGCSGAVLSLLAAEDADGLEAFAARLPGGAEPLSPLLPPPPPPVRASVSAPEAIGGGGGRATALGRLSGARLALLPWGRSPRLVSQAGPAPGGGARAAAAPAAVPPAASASEAAAAPSTTSAGRPSASSIGGGSEGGSGVIPGLDLGRAAAPAAAPGAAPSVSPPPPSPPLPADAESGPTPVAIRTREGGTGRVAPGLAGGSSPLATVDSHAPADPLPTPHPHSAAAAAYSPGVWAGDVELRLLRGEGAEAGAPAPAAGVAVLARLLGGPGSCGPRVRGLGPLIAAVEDAAAGGDLPPLLPAAALLRGLRRLQSERALPENRGLAGLLVVASGGGAAGSAARPSPPFVDGGEGTEVLWVVACPPGADAGAGVAEAAVDRSVLRRVVVSGGATGLPPRRGGLLGLLRARDAAPLAQLLLRAALLPAGGV